MRKERSLLSIINEGAKILSTAPFPHAIIINFFSVFNKDLKASFFSIESFSQMGFLKFQAPYLNLATFLYIDFVSLQHQSLILLVITQYAKCEPD